MPIEDPIQAGLFVLLIVFAITIIGALPPPQDKE